jgi:hypothetical protein
MAFATMKFDSGNTSERLSVVWAITGTAESVAKDIAAPTRTALRRWWIAQSISVPFPLVEFGKGLCVPCLFCAGISGRTAEENPQEFQPAVILLFQTTQHLHPRTNSSYV